MRGRVPLLLPTDPTVRVRHLFSERIGLSAMAENQEWRTVTGLYRIWYVMTTLAAPIDILPMGSCEYGLRVAIGCGSRILLAQSVARSSPEWSDADVG